MKAFSVSQGAGQQQCVLPPDHDDRSTADNMYQCRGLLVPTRQVTRATHVRNRVCPRVELILKIIIILLIRFLGLIKSKPC